MSWATYLRGYCPTACLLPELLLWSGGPLTDSSSNFRSHTDLCPLGISWGWSLLPVPVCPWLTGSRFLASCSVFRIPHFPWYFTGWKASQSRGGLRLAGGSLHFLMAFISRQATFCQPAQTAVFHFTDFGETVKLFLFPPSSFCHLGFPRAVRSVNLKERVRSSGRPGGSRPIRNASVLPKWTLKMDSKI